MKQNKHDCNNAFVINSMELPLEGVYFNEFVVGKPNKTIINGEIYNTEKQPVEGAVIQVNRVNLITNKKYNMGYSITDEFGRYVFSLIIYNDCVYEFTAYSPLKIGD